MIRTKTVSILALDGVQLTDACGTLDVFAEANKQTGKTIYRLEVVGTKQGPIQSSSGVRLMADRVIGSDSLNKTHTFLVAGAPGLPDFQPTQKLLDALKEELRQARRYGSICTGAFLLAATGKLSKRRVTTHWAVADALAQKYPSLSVEKDALYVRDGPVRTAAGVTAGMDLALSLVTEDVGREIAKSVASQLVMFFKRPGGQLQFSRDESVSPNCRTTFQELQRWVAANPAEDLTVPQLAERVGLSTRHFTRLFRAETNTSPAVWVEAARVEAARAMLESSDSSPKQVAIQCGFADVNVMRRAFRRQIGITPSEYSKRFH
ncbi:GlxA family transcriptional regulator [Gimesia aquarii]|uniref:HTH-type transcriptional regulator CdhR n=1 Tax=Gimesia aquarii TaxID=2527964 RepID=A0A517W1Z5_9PLAN|nr:helix-turn-helix domain-containing protein [Gimesia aquarii]QDT99274.1 HTH-type transcriptional regulator CdhR [Gimesia aquarii]